MAATRSFRGYLPLLFLLTECTPGVGPGANCCSWSGSDLLGSQLRPILGSFLEGQTSLRVGLEQARGRHPLPRARIPVEGPSGNWLAPRRWRIDPRWSPSVYRCVRSGRFTAHSEVGQTDLTLTYHARPVDVRRGRRARSRMAFPERGFLARTAHRSRIADLPRVSRA